MKNYSKDDMKRITSEQRLALDEYDFIAHFVHVSLLVVNSISIVLFCHEIHRVYDEFVWDPFSKFPTSCSTFDVFHMLSASTR